MRQRRRRTRRRSRATAVPSIEFCTAADEARARAATASGSRPSEEPASAPEPYGETAARCVPVRQRGRRRAAAPRRGPAGGGDSSTGWACCRWVRPGMATPRCCSAWPARASTRSSTSAAMIAGVVAQVHPAAAWRPGRCANGRPAAGRRGRLRRARSARVRARCARPRRLGRARRRRDATSAASRSRPASIAAELVVVEQPGAGAARGRGPCEPAMSYGASRQSKWVDLLTARRARPRGRRRTGRPTAAPVLSLASDQLLRRPDPASASWPGPAGRGAAAILLGQAPQLDEALGVRLVEGVAGVVGGEVEVVQAGVASGGR